MAARAPQDVTRFSIAQDLGIEMLYARHQRYRLPLHI